MERKITCIPADKKPDIKDTEKEYNVAAYCRVSTDDKNQLQSLKSQKAYYEDKIKENKNWHLVNIYSDEAVTGTKASIRPGFLQMIEDCEKGKINIILTKSISRFARNTVDLLKYVRRLKELMVAVVFEEENINTMTMDGEFLLTILSSVAQQEVSNTSEHIKAGLRMKLSRGELIGNNDCYGYRYDKETKQIYVVEEEAKVVRYIFEQYAEGYGVLSIKKKLEAQGIKTKKGNSKWSTRTLTDIIRNVKYKGDCKFGETYITDAIGKVRKRNDGTRDIYLLEQHHESIISPELFDKANEILASRSAHKKENIAGPFLDFTGKYTLSKKVKCAYCGASYTRRVHHKNKDGGKVVWRCITSTMQGVRKCPESEAIDDAVIYEAFHKIMESLRSMDSSLLLSLIGDAKKNIAEVLPKKNETGIQNAIKALNQQKSYLVDHLLEGKLSKDEYDLKMKGLDDKLDTYQKDLIQIQSTKKRLKSIEERLSETMDFILSKEEITSDDYLIDAIIKGVIIGGYDNGVSNPYMITFVFSRNHLNNLDDMNVIPFKTLEMPHIFHSFKRDEDGDLFKVCHTSLTIRAAVEA